MQWTRLATLGWISIGLAGCQCCELTERYQDHIDHIADRSPHLERFYHPGLDLTRIGYPDWCQNPINRAIYGDCCCRDTRQQPAYIHNPFFDPSVIRTRANRVQEDPQIPPRPDTGPDSSADDPVPTQLRGIPDSKELEKGDTMPLLRELPPSPVPPAPNSPVPPSLNAPSGGSPPLPPMEQP